MGHTKLGAVMALSGRYPGAASQELYTTMPVPPRVITPVPMPTQPILMPPAPGNPGNIGGIINDIIQRIPIPRPTPPRLPTPTPAPRPAPAPGRRIPLPIPIPIPGDIFNGNGNAQCPPGYHKDKTTGTKCVRNRKMNALNPRALKRSISRICRFQDFVNKTASVHGMKVTRRVKSCSKKKRC
jgi:hypothetical protein